MKISFNEPTHTYRDEETGEILPSVTQVIEGTGLSDFSMVSSEILAIAQERGTIVHQVTKMHDDGDLDEDSVDIDLMGYFTAYKKFLTEYSPKVVFSERIVFSEKHRYAGTLDRVYEIGKQKNKILVDIKTGSPEHSHAIQLSGYGKALKEELPKLELNGCWGLYLNNDGTFSVKNYSEETPQGWIVFLSALNVYRWKKNKNLI